MTGGIKMLYIFVDIKLDASHFIDTVAHNFAKDGKLFTHFDLLMFTINPKTKFFVSFHGAYNFSKYPTLVNLKTKAAMKMGS